MCGIACLLLIVLWVRSWSVQSSAVTWYGDQWKRQVPGQRYYSIFSNRGAIRFSTSNTTGNWGVQVLESDRAVLGFGYLKGQTSHYAQVPHWFLVALTAAGATMPWLPWSWRFSFRTLLIGMTLMAIAIGLIAVASR